MSDSMSYVPGTNDNLDAIDRRKLAWCLVISGHKYRYYSGVAPSAAQVDFPYGNLQEPPSSTVQYPTDVECIVDVGPVVSQMDDVKGVSAQEPVEVTLIAYNARTAAGARIHPADDLMRVAGHRSSDLYVRLKTSLTHVPPLTGSQDIEVEKNVVGWPIPCALHIGQEVMWATGTDGTGTDVDPYKFTGVTRGADPYWTTQEHVVDEVKAERPYVCSNVTTWRGRKAWIFVSAIQDDGVEFGWSMYWSGFLDSNPEMDGETIKLRVAPLTAVMNYKLGVGTAARTATTMPGFHRFRIEDVDDDDRAAAHKLEAFVDWSVNIPALTVIAADSIAGTLTLADADAAFMTSLGYYSTLNILFTTFGALPYSATIEGWSDPDLVFTSPEGLDLVDALAAEFTGGATTVQVHMYGVIKERFHIQLVDPADGPVAIVEWPQALQTAVNVAASWQPDLFGVHSWRDPSGDGGPERLARLAIIEGDQWVVRGFNKALTAPLVGGDIEGKYRINRRYSTTNCWAGLVAHRSVEDTRKHKLNDNSEIKWFPTERDALNDRNDAEVWGGGDFSGPAVWFYQPGEHWIGPFDRDIWAGGSQTMVVRGPGTEAHMQIQGSYSAVLPDGATGYFFQVRSPNDVVRREPCIQMPGDKNLTAEVKAGINNSSPPQFILRLLSSGIGNSDNGSFDTFPIGCNIPGDYIDDDSFTAIGSVAPLDQQNYEAVRGKTIAEQTEGLLLAYGAQVASVYDPEDTAYGNWKLHLVHMGLADSTSYKMDISDADMLISESGIPVKTMVDGRTIRSYELKVNYPPQGATDAEKKEAEVINVDCSAERNDAGGDHGDALKLDLPGVVILTDDQAQAAAEIVADLRTRVGYPRVRWIFSIRADMPGAVGLGLGDTIRVTSSYALGIIPSQTATNVPARVVGLKKDLWENTLELEVRPYPGMTAGWAPSGVVNTTPTANSVTTLYAGRYSPTAGTDASWLAAGDKVTRFAPGDWANRTDLTVLSVTLPNTVTFTGAHGASAGDIIRTDDYAAAVTDQKGFAFLADSDGELGTSDPGYLLG